MRSEIDMFLEDRLHPSTFDYVNEYCVDPGDPFILTFEESLHT